MTKERYLTKFVIEDLEKKMVFVGGPRQVGKTTLALELVSKRFGRPGYFNWDSRIDRRKIMQSVWPGDADLIILDEIHKYKKWKSFVKGEYDTLKEKYRFLIAGSARLYIYRKGGIQCWVAITIIACIPLPWLKPPEGPRCLRL
jgi:predicted AAA+ superfamily ATPase